MPILGNILFDKLKKSFDSAIENVIGEEKKDNSFNYNDKKFFSKEKHEEEILNAPVSKKVWVNGQSFTIFATSPQELENKVSKFKKGNPENSNNIENPEQMVFGNLYTEHEEHEINEWIYKRDVWIDEYSPA